MRQYREDDHQEYAPHFSAKILEAVYEMPRGPARGPYETPSAHEYGPEYEYEYGPSDLS